MPLRARLKLTRARMQRISGLDACTTLLELDLSNNNVTAISGLESLTALRKLTLTSNRITAITGLHTLSLLEHLLLQSNLLGSFESLNLDMLAQLPGLRTLYLCNIDRSQVKGGSGLGCG